MSNEKPGTSTEPVHAVGAAKLIVHDIGQVRDFYQTMFGMQVVNHYHYAPEVFEEYIMGYEKGARLALFEPNPAVEQPLPKSDYPQALIYTDSFEETTQRIKGAGHRLHFLTPRESTERKVAIAYDPSGNVVEIIYAKGANRVGAAKLIVDSRERAEAFYCELFSPELAERFDTSLYDEVILRFHRGALLALFQPRKEAPLAKSAFPVAALHTSDFDGVVSRLDELGARYRSVDTRGSGTRIVIAKDPAGNAVEIISS